MTDAGTATATTDPAAAVETFIETSTEALASLGADEETLSSIDTAGADLVETITSQQARLDELENQVEALESELKSERETRAKEAAEDRKRLHDLETQVDEDASKTDAAAESDQPADVETPSGPATAQVQPPETPLEDVVRIPEYLVTENLTANQRRARFVAKNVHEYTQRVPAGRAIKSSELRRVLTAGEDARIYTETVSRVIEFLDDLGGDAVQVRESKQGERVVVFTERFVRRVRTYQQHSESNTVVTDGGIAR